MKSSVPVTVSLNKEQKKALFFFLWEGRILYIWKWSKPNDFSGIISVLHQQKQD